MKQLESLYLGEMETMSGEKMNERETEISSHGVF